MSIIDMLPEYETPLPKGCGTGKKCEKNFNLVERVCPRCRKTFFFRTGQTAYIRQTGGRMVRFCSWSCKYADERERKTAKPGGCTKTVEQRIAERLEKIERDKKMLEGMQITAKERRRIVNRLQRLRKEVKELREMEEYEDSCCMRGIAGGDDRAAPSGA